MLRKAIAILILVLTTGTLHAHVGSADVYYEGDAGPYHLFVSVLLPKVIPGVAEIQIRSSSPDVQSIRVSSLRLSGLGSKYAPSPEDAERSSVDPQYFTGSLWFMEYGAMQVRIEANGSRGRGGLSIPVASYAQQALPMSRGLGFLLLAAFLFLALGVVVISGAVVRESTVPFGERPQIAKRRRAWAVMAGMLALVLLFVSRERSSWKVEAEAYERNVDLLKPPRATLNLVEGNQLHIRPAAPLLVPIAGHDGEANEVSMDDVIPDHGHIMHLFLVGKPGLYSIWHLHPNRAGKEFIETLPRMPAGQYLVYADIVDKQGFPWTMVGDLDIPQIKGNAISGDDSDWIGAPLQAPFADTTLSRLPDGGRMVWERGDAPLKANQPARLNFRVETMDGSPAGDLEPYMGMAAHAEIICADLSVFAHIHPAGSISMAALDLAQSGTPAMASSDGSATGMSGSMKMDKPMEKLPPRVNFPYGFPHPGFYRIFVQVKRSGTVQTAVFGANVQ